MLRVGLTGGIGSGKSSVAALLRQFGAYIVDADQVAREVVAPGQPALATIAERFGNGVLLGDGSLDRVALGRIVFGDQAALRDLEAITHPAIGERTEELFSQAPVDEVLVHDMPLLVEKQMTASYHLVLVVMAPEEVRVRRLVDLRGMREEDARARIAAQASDQDRIQAADVVIDNAGDAAALKAVVEQLWRDRLDVFDDNLLTLTRAKRQQAPAMPMTNWQQNWSGTADRAIGRIITALEGVVDVGLVGVDHIGSTAVEGLAAKNVIDIQVRLRSLADADRPDFEVALNRAGYVHVAEAGHDNSKDESEWPKQFYGSMDPGQQVHLHVRTDGSPGANFALAFRDWLRANPDERSAYEATKRGLVDTAADTTAYSESKEPWFDEVYPRVMEWWARRPSA